MSLILLTLLAGQVAKPANLVAQALSDDHRHDRFVRVEAPCITPEGLQAELTRLEEKHGAFVRGEEIGRSFQGRPIRLLSVGEGPASILMWSQMHGDEPSATPAILDLVDFLARQRQAPDVARILRKFTLRLIPMLNPDGASRYERRNGQGIDINRDALMLTTPEGRLLKAVRERFRPILGFNLHDQSRRVMVGTTGVLSSISLLAVAGDEKGTLTPGRLRAQRVASRIARTLTPFIPGGVARYDEDWNPRAFGDNLTAWGTPIVLIESGAFPKGGTLQDLTRLNFVALVTVLRDLARNDLVDETPARYAALPRNRADAWADFTLLGASIIDPQTGQTFQADLAFDILASDQSVGGCPAAADRKVARVIEIGDSRLVTPGRAIPGSQFLIASLPSSLALPPGRHPLSVLNPHEGETPAALLARVSANAPPLRRNGPASFIAFSSAQPDSIVIVTNGEGIDELGGSKP